MAQRDVLPNITDPTLIPTGAPQPATGTAAAVEESKGLFTTIAENKLIVLIVIIVIIAIGIFAYFVAYKGTDKEETLTKTIPHNFAGQGQGLQSQQPQQSHQALNQASHQAQYLQQQAMMQGHTPAQHTAQQPTQQPQASQQVAPTSQSAQSTQPVQSAKPTQPAASTVSGQTNGSSRPSSALDLLNRSKNSLQMQNLQNLQNAQSMQSVQNSTNIHDNVKNIAMQNVTSAPMSVAPQNNSNAANTPLTASLDESFDKSFDTRHTEEGEFEHHGDINGVNGSINSVNNHNDVAYDEKDAKMMSSMLGLAENQHELDMDERFDKAFDLQQENLTNVSQLSGSFGKPSQQIAHCEFMVGERYCKLPVKVGNKCHIHQNK